MKIIQKAQLWACKDNERVLIQEYQDEALDYITRLELPRFSKFKPFDRDSWLEITFEKPVEFNEEE